MTEAGCVLDARAALGEGPLWDPTTEALYWVDITGRKIHRFHPASGHDEQWATPEDIGSLAVRARGGLVVAMKSGFHFFDPEDARFTVIADPERDRRDNRFNDGKPDRQGRFWAGSVHGAFARPTGGLYRLDADLSCRRVVDGIACSNSLCWSPDSRTMYYGDSMARTIWAWDFDPDDGAVRNRRVFVEVPPAQGEPDGATVDAEGCVWVAMWDGARVVRYDPRGRIDRVVVLPVSRPTCPMFGGRDLDLLYVTSAAADDPAREPLAGGIFALDPGVKGLPEAHFQG